MDKAGTQVGAITTGRNREMAVGLTSHYASRRAFLTQALAAASGLALGELVLLSPLEAAAASTPTNCTDLPGAPASNPGDLFKPVAEFASKGGRLYVGITVVGGWKKVAVIADAGYQCRTMLLRYYEGRDLNSGSKSSKWPLEPHLPGPGPTLRAKVGDIVDVHLLNDIKPADFAKTSLESCDIRINPTSATPYYPGTDTPPSCLHGDNVTNMHYHGTHVTPDGSGDNVMVDVAPLTQTGLPPHFYKGRFDNHFQLTPAPSDQELGDQSKPFKMGQAPGTHWYHAHKHGSVALQLLSGMAGAFIIEGPFDEQLEKILPGLRKTEKVLVIQQLGDQVGVNSGGSTGIISTYLGGNPFPLVNGQVSPTIEMQPGEIQRWRFINATMSETAWLRYQFQPLSPGGPVPEIRQIAYDGIQLAPERYLDQLFGQSQQFTLAPGNRVDLLVKAPASGQANLVFTPIHGSQNIPQPILVTLKVSEVSGSPAAEMNFPDQSNYPPMPLWLKWDEKDPRNQIQGTRRLRFDNDATQRPAIDGKAFDGHVNQLIALNTAEEWVLENYWPGSIHPFHIHVNPFQVLEVYDPNAQMQTVLSAPYNWADTFVIPAAGTVNGQFTPGRLRIRTRYTDFAGTFVLHCHLLDHEDRGMMQEVEIVDLNAPKLEQPMHH
jgi:FtsP/CotA-like multicopper oxidase with cupredoxin domain